MEVAVEEPVEVVRGVFAKEARPDWDGLEQLCEVFRVADDLKDLQHKLERVRKLGPQYALVDLSPHVQQLVNLLDKAST